MINLADAKIVVPSDFSSLSKQALDAVLDTVNDPGQVHVIHVLANLTAIEPGVVWEQIDDEARRQAANEALDEHYADNRYAGINKSVTFGDAGHGIVDYAKDNDADMIVIASHGRQGVQRFFVGSVAERVVRFAECPVLVFKEK